MSWCNGSACIKTDAKCQTHIAYNDFFPVHRELLKDGILLCLQNCIFLLPSYRLEAAFDSNELVWIAAGQDFDHCVTLGFCWLRLVSTEMLSSNKSFDSWHSPFWNLLDLPKACFQRNSETNEYLGCTNDLSNIHDCAKPTSQFHFPSFLSHLDFVGAWVLACLWFSGNRLVPSLFLFVSVWDLIEVKLL